MPRAPLPEGIELIDVDLFDTPGLSCSYLVHSSEPTLIETGPATVSNTVARKLAERDIEPAHVVLTHIHLDHAGGAGHIADLYPNAHIWVHDVGAPHVNDPSRLIASARRLFGDALDTMWGEPRPVDDSRMTAVSDGDVIGIGDRELQVLYTPGHANHEVTLYEPHSQVAFIGDSGGVYFGESFQKPATPPPEFDLEKAIDSLKKIARLNTSAICFTHYGPADEQSLARATADLQKWDSLLRPLAIRNASEDELVSAVDAAIDPYPGGHDDQSARAKLNSTRNSVLGYARYYRKTLGLGSAG